jgi:hypothetical protein
MDQREDTKGGLQLKIVERDRRRHTEENKMESKRELNLLKVFLGKANHEFSFSSPSERGKGKRQRKIKKEQKPKTKMNITSFCSLSFSSCSLIAC